MKLLRNIANFDNRPIGACMMKLNLRYLASLNYHFERDQKTYNRRITREEMENELKRNDLILSTRLLNVRFLGIIDFEKAAIAAADTPIEEIQKVLVS